MNTHRRYERKRHVKCPLILFLLIVFCNRKIFHKILLILKMPNNKQTCISVEIPMNKL